MAEEEKQETEETTEEQAPASEQAPEEAAPADDAEAEQGEADPAAPGREAEEADGQLIPVSLRRCSLPSSYASARARVHPALRGLSSRPRSARPSAPRSRQTASVRRRRYRAARRAKRGEPGQGTPKPEREPGSKKVRQGTVVSAAADKTITVEIPVVRRHPTYEKVVRRTSKLHAHDESNTAQEGDVVRVIESRPLSRTKRWRLLDVVERSR